MKNLNVMYTSNTDNWATPSKVYNGFMNRGYYDPCPLFASGFDFNIDELGKSRLFINPPFSTISKWVDFAIECSYLGIKVVMLLPCRTDTRYFQKLFKSKASFYFITGRLHFNDKGCAPFPSVLVHLDHMNRLYSIDRDELERLSRII